MHNGVVWKVVMSPESSRGIDILHCMPLIASFEGVGGEDNKDPVGRFLKAKCICGMNICDCLTKMVEVLM